MAKKKGRNGKAAGGKAAKAKAPETKKTKTPKADLPAASRGSAAQAREVVPLAALKESINKAAYSFTEKHLGPKEEIGNKGGAPSRTACAPSSTPSPPHQARSNDDRAFLWQEPGETLTTPPISFNIALQMAGRGDP